MDCRRGRVVSCKCRFNIHTYIRLPYKGSNARAHERAAKDLSPIHSRPVVVLLAVDVLMFQRESRFSLGGMLARIPWVGVWRNNSSAGAIIAM